MSIEQQLNQELAAFQDKGRRVTQLLDYVKAQNEQLEAKIEARGGAAFMARSPELLAAIQRSCQLEEKVNERVSKLKNDMDRYLQ